MFKGFKNLDEALRVISDDRNSDVLEKINALKEVKSRLNPPAPQDGLMRLERISQDVFGTGRYDEGIGSGAGFSEVLSFIANEGINGSDQHRFRKLFRNFLEEIELLRSGVDLSSDQPENISTGVKIQADVGVETAPDKKFSHVAKKDSEKITAKEDEAISDSAETDMDPFIDYAGAPLSSGWSGTGKTPLERIANGELMRLPGVLPPPPNNSDGGMFASWLEGEIWNPLAFNIKLKMDDESNADDLIEMLSEFHAVPDAACKTYKSRNPVNCDDGQSDAEFLFRSGRDLGFYGTTIINAVEELSNSVGRYFEEYEPRSAEFLFRAGFDVRCDPKLAVIIASALDIEKFFLEDAPLGADKGDLHDFRGAISPRSRLDVPHILDRAVFMHFTSGADISKILSGSLTELRHAQTIRHFGYEVSVEEFDASYRRDNLLSLDEMEFTVKTAEEPAYPQ